MGKSKLKKAHTTAFHLNTGEVEYVVGYKHSKRYSADYKDLIQKFTPLYSEAEVQTYKNMLADAKKEQAAKKDSKKKGKKKKGSLKDDSPVKPAPIVEVSAEDRDKMNQAVREISDDKPKPRIEIYYKTTHDSNLVVYVIRCKTVDGKDEWTLNMHDFYCAASKYITYFPLPNAMVNKAISKWDVMHQRDIEKGINSTKARPWENPTTGNITHYPFFIITGEISLEPPYASSQEEETPIIEQLLSQIGEGIKAIIVDWRFSSCYEAAVTSKNRWQKIGWQRADGTIPYMVFGEKACVRVIRCMSFVNHIVQIDSNTLIDKLRFSKVTPAKYEIKYDTEDDSSKASDSGSSSGSDSDDSTASDRSNKAIKVVLAVKQEKEDTSTKSEDENDNTAKVTPEKRKSGPPANERPKRATKPTQKIREQAND